MRDVFTEIWESIRRNKLRTCLTGFAVSWGIFMLIVLLGAGNGLMNAFLIGGEGISTNVMQVGGGRTSKPYDGLEEGRAIELDDRDVALTGSDLFSAHVDQVISSVSTSETVSYGRKYFSGSIEGNFPARQQMDKIEILYGRFLNEKDIRDRRKVVVLPQDQAETLLGNDIRDTGARFPGVKLDANSGKKVHVQDLVGKYIKIGSISYRVVGIAKSNDATNSNTVYAPYTTIRTIYAKGRTVDDITFTFHGLNSEKENEAFEEQYRTAVNLRHRAAPDDTRAVWIWNRFMQNLQMNKGRNILSTALWVIGLFTLLGGIVGVSNIMLITVKERTHEFGIRKAIGANPWSVMKLILAESVTITAFFGYVGMLLGMIACQVLDKTVGQSSVSIMDTQVAMFVNPTVGLDVAVEATLVLIIAGTLAGLFPARKAAQVRPIEALRAE
ncbi:MAG: ABC transporter permease [Bacteroidales bacterium]|jgi:putative ABC transport system permease protein|nr:ABC transporter permease [Bacteroidales bacterium]